ncbi:MAG TPA: AlpA family phage regulatory protein [Acidobacteriaceae bacterium]|nr:AlpA family phage regulatory protein [Acidobacteriaceae bacterium]
MAATILRLPPVSELTGLSRSAIYFQIAQDTFPRQVALGARAVGWRHSDIQTWLDSLPTRTTEQSIRLL